MTLSHPLLQPLLQPLSDGITALKLSVPAQAQQQLLDYIALLHKWNRVYNLTAIRDLNHMISHHVLDSLAALPALPEHALRLLDVGSGGGMPGLPFAIARPQWTVTLLDSNHKKTAFLQQAAIDLGLTNVTVMTARVEAYQPAMQFDVITSRAFSSLRDFVQLTRHLLAEQGRYAAFKGTSPSEEIAQLPADVVVDTPLALQVPGIQAERHLVMMRMDK